MDPLGSRTSGPMYPQRWRHTAQHAGHKQAQRDGPGAAYKIDKVPGGMQIYTNSQMCPSSTRKNRQMQASAIFQMTRTPHHLRIIRMRTSIGAFYLIMVGDGSWSTSDRPSEGFLDTEDTESLPKAANEHAQHKKPVCCHLSV